VTVAAVFDASLGNVEEIEGRQAALQFLLFAVEAIRYLWWCDGDQKSMQSSIE
jgi:hypothetical protein